jgi:hypothetical protein
MRLPIKFGAKLNLSKARRTLISSEHLGRIHSKNGKYHARLRLRRIYFSRDSEGSCNWLLYANFSHTGVIIVVAATMIITAV